MPHVRSISPSCRLSAIQAAHIHASAQSGARAAYPAWTEDARRQSGRECPRAPGSQQVPASQNPAPGTAAVRGATPRRRPAPQPPPPWQVGTAAWAVGRRVKEPVGGCVYGECVPSWILIEQGGPSLPPPCGDSPCRQERSRRREDDARLQRCPPAVLAAAAAAAVAAAA